MRPSQAFLVLSFGLLAALLTSGCTAPELTVRLSQEDLQREVNERFPIVRSWIIARVSIHDPKVKLQPGSQELGLQVDVTTSGIGIETTTGRVELWGKLRYEPKNATFYMDRPRVERLELPGLAPALTSELSRQISQLVQRDIEPIALHTLKTTEDKDAVARKVLKSARVEGKQLVLVLGPPVQDQAP